MNYRIVIGIWRYMMLLEVMLRKRNDMVYV